MDAIYINKLVNIKKIDLKVIWTREKSGDSTKGKEKTPKIPEPVYRVIENIPYIWKLILRYRVPHSPDENRVSPWFITVTIPEVHCRNRILKTGEEEKQRIIYKGKLNTIVADFSIQILKGKRA